MLCHGHIVCVLHCVLCAQPHVVSGYGVQMRCALAHTSIIYTACTRYAVLPRSNMFYRVVTSASATNCRFCHPEWLKADWKSYTTSTMYIYSYNMQHTVQHNIVRHGFVCSVYTEQLSLSHIHTTVARRTFTYYTYYVYIYIEMLPAAYVYVIIWSSRPLLYLYNECMRCVYVCVSVVYVFRHNTHHTIPHAAPPLMCLRRFDRFSFLYLYWCCYLAIALQQLFPSIFYIFCVFYRQHFSFVFAFRWSVQSDLRRRSVKRVWIHYTLKQNYWNTQSERESSLLNSTIKQYENNNSKKHLFVMMK